MVLSGIFRPLRRDVLGSPAGSICSEALAGGPDAHERRLCLEPEMELINKQDKTIPVSAVCSEAAPERVTRAEKG